MSRISVVVAVTALLCGAALADDRKIDFGQVLLDDDDKPITECLALDQERRACAETIQVTLGIEAARALNQRFQDEAQLPIEELIRRGQMSYWIKRAGVVSLTTASKCDHEFADCLTVADRDLIRKNVGKMGWGALLTWRVLAALEGRAQ